MARGRTIYFTDIQPAKVSRMRSTESDDGDYEHGVQIREALAWDAARGGPTSLAHLRRLCAAP